MTTTVEKLQPFRPIGLFFFIQSHEGRKSIIIGKKVKNSPYGVVYVQFDTHQFRIAHCGQDLNITLLPCGFCLFSLRTCPQKEQQDNVEQPITLKPKLLENGIFNTSYSTLPSC